MFLLYEIYLLYNVTFYSVVPWQLNVMNNRFVKKLPRTAIFVIGRKHTGKCIIVNLLVFTRIAGTS